MNAPLITSFAGQFTERDDSPSVQSSPGGTGAKVQRFQPAAQLVRFLGMSVCVCDTEQEKDMGGAEAWGRVSVRLTPFVLSLFFLEESYERLPRCLALQRVEMGEESVDGGKEWSEMERQGEAEAVSCICFRILCSALESFSLLPVNVKTPVFCCLTVDL